MTATAKWRGHPIWFDKGQECWKYEDTGARADSDPDRPCGFCGRQNTPEGHDPCLGTLQGVRNACCGHGEPNCAYVQFSDGTDLRGDDAIAFFIKKAMQCQN